MAKMAQLTMTKNMVYTWPTKAGAFSNLSSRRNFSTISRTKKYSPQNRKVQLAPCQMPVAAQTTNRLNTCRPLPRRLPPRGIYTYSRNQVDREMCHRRQNSVMLLEI